jgi:hypothetical protein
VNVERNNRAPILVTGAHRSGTTWVGKMLAADGDTAYISEPLNVLHRPGVLRAPVRYWYTYINGENELHYLSAFQELLDFDYHLLAEIRSLRSRHDLLRMLRDFGIFYLGSMHGQRALLKDPFAVFSAPWFADRLACRVVITVRHPAGFASSLKRLNWPFDFADLLAQPAFVREHLVDDRAELERVSPDDILGQAALLWRIVYRTVERSEGGARISSSSGRRTWHETRCRVSAACTARSVWGLRQRSNGPSCAPAAPAIPPKRRAARSTRCASTAAPTWAVGRNT